MEEDGDRGRAPRAPHVPAPSDVALLISIRREDGAALHEFVRRFRPLLLDQARRLGVYPSERENVVTVFLDDILLKLADMQAPRSLPTFVVKSVRNHVVCSSGAANTYPCARSRRGSGSAMPRRDNAPRDCARDWRVQVFNILPT